MVSQFLTRGIVLLFIFVLSIGSLRAETLVLLGSDNLPPKSWMDGDVARGYAIDATHEALKRAGFDVEFDLKPWKRAVETARQGGGVITHFSKTPERQKSFLYSDPIVFDRIVVAVKKGREFPFKSVKYLAGKTVGVLRGVAYGKDWSEYVSTFTREEDTDAEARLGKLLRERIDAAVISSGAAGLKIAAQNAKIDPAEFTILAEPILLDPNYLGIAKRPENEEKIARINAAIKSMREDGTIKKILAKYGDKYGAQ